MILSEGGTYELVGRTGSGKTFYAVREMLRLLLQGKAVYSNIKLKWPAVLRYAKRHGIPKIPEGNYRYVPETNIENFHRLLTPGASIYIDEAQLIWNARDFKETDKSQREMLSFLTQARHQKCTVCIITQHENNVDAQMARIAVAIVRMRNLLQLPSMEFIWKVLGKPKWMQLSFATTCDRDGRSVLDRDRFYRDPLIGACYDTTQMHASFGLGGAAPEPVTGTVKHGHPGVIFALIGAFFFLLGWWFEPAKPATVVKKEKAPSPLVMPAPVGATPATLQNAPAAEPPKKGKGLAGWRAAVAEDWASDDESNTLPRYYRVADGVLTFMNDPRAMHVGDVWQGGRIKRILPESPTSAVIVLGRTQTDKESLYVRIYRNGSGARPANGRSGPDSVPAPRGRVDQQLEPESLASHALGGVKPSNPNLYIPGKTP